MSRGTLHPRPQRIGGLSMNARNALLACTGSLLCLALAGAASSPPAHARPPAAQVQTPAQGEGEPTPPPRERFQIMLASTPTSPEPGIECRADISSAPAGTDMLRLRCRGLTPGVFYTLFLGQSPTAGTTPVTLVG